MRPSLEGGAGRHERQRRAHQTSGRETHDELDDNDGLRVQRTADIVGARGEMTITIVFSSTALQQEVFGSTRSRAVVLWSAMVAQRSEWPRVGLVACRSSSRRWRANLESETASYIAVNFCSIVI